MNVIGRKRKPKPKTAISGRNWPVSGKSDFEAFRGRIWKNLKHKSCSEQFFLEGYADGFAKWGSNGLCFYENPRLICPDLVYTSSGFQIKTGTNPCRTGFFLKHESFRIFQEQELLWRQVFQIPSGFLNTTWTIKTVQRTRNSCTGFSTNIQKNCIFTPTFLFWLWKLFQKQFWAFNDFYKVLLWKPRILK